MSLLTNRNKQTDPPVKSKPKTAAELLKENDEKMAKQGYKPKLDEKGNRIVRRDGNSESYDYIKQSPITTTTTKTGRPSAPIMQAEQTKKTGQKQVGTRYWDDEKKQWKVSK